MKFYVFSFCFSLFSLPNFLPGSSVFSLRRSKSFKNLFSVQSVHSNSQFSIAFSTISRHSKWETFDIWSKTINLKYIHGVTIFCHCKIITFSIHKIVQTFFGFQFLLFWIVFFSVFFWIFFFTFPESISVRNKVPLWVN